MCAKRIPWLYRFFFVRRLFLPDMPTGVSEKVDDVRSASIIGAILVVVRTLAFPVGVSVVLVRMRTLSPQFVFMPKRRGPGDQSEASGLEAAITSRFASFRVGSLAFAARTATLTSRSISFPMARLPTPILFLPTKCEG